MDKNIINVDDFNLTANVDKGVCPLDWLAKYYKEYPGKLVMLDKNLLSFLLNMSSCDEILASEFDGFKQSFTIKWNATEEYPETKIVVTSYGRDEIAIEDNQYIVDSDTNYYVIEELKADDILVNNIKYAENMTTDRQIITLVSNELTNTNITNEC